MLGALATLAGVAILLDAILGPRAEGAGAGNLVVIVGLALFGLGFALRSDAGSDATSAGQAPGATAYFTRLWAGHVPLAVTFWLWGVSLNIVFALPYVLTGSPASLLLHATYWCAMSVPIWRSSTRYQGAVIWPILARVCLMLGLLRTAVAVHLAFILP